MFYLIISVLIMAFALSCIVGLGLMFVMNRRSPEFKLQRSVRPVVLNKLAQRECISFSIQLPSGLNEHELSALCDVTNAIAASLSIKPEQLRLSERLLNTLSLRRQELTPQQVEWLDQSRFRKQDHVLASLAFEPILLCLLKMLGRQGPRALDLRHKDDFEDFLIFNSLETVIRRFSEVQPRRSHNFYDGAGNVIPKE